MIYLVNFVIFYGIFWWLNTLSSFLSSSGSQGMVGHSGEAAASAGNLLEVQFLL